MAEQKKESATASPQASPRNGPAGSKSTTKAPLRPITIAVPSPLKNPVESKVAKRPSTKKSKTASAAPQIQTLPPVIPATPLFDDGDKWAAHVLMSASTIASQKSIGTEGITFPVRIEKWGQNKTIGGGSGDAGSSASASASGSGATGANRGAVVVVPGTQKDQKGKGGKRDMKSYFVSA